MNDDPSNTTMPPDEQLVAYLDGELDAESSRRIEELLGSNAEVRRHLQEMELTWDLLDELDVAPSDGQFTQSTLEMAAVEASRDVERSLAEAPRRRRLRMAAVGGGVLAAVAAGFLAVAVLTPDPNAELLQDLPVLENLDEYRQIGDIEFLYMLRDAGLFAKENGDVSEAVAAPPDELLDQRRQRIVSMPPGEKEQLLGLQERFAALDEDQQEQLRRLHVAIRGAGDSQRLRRIMHRYCEWLKTMPPYTRAELAEAKPSDRIRSVTKRLNEEQARDDARRFSAKDAEALLRWIGQCSAQYESRFLETLPKPEQKKFAELSPPLRRRMVFAEMWQQWKSGGFGTPPFGMTDDDLARLRAELSPEVRKRLESKPTAEQWRMVANLAHRALQHKAAARAMHGQMPKADDERLAKFFENELNDADRDRLLGLPGEEMQRELQRLYLRRTKPPEAPERHSDNPKHGRWPGGDWPMPKNMWPPETP